MRARRCRACGARLGAALAGLSPLCTSSQPDAVKLHRVFLLPEAQGRGIGTRLVEEVLAASRATRRPVRLRVLRVNPARRLYERLGFKVTGETETHFEMERPA